MGIHGDLVGMHGDLVGFRGVLIEFRGIVVGLLRFKHYKICRHGDLVNLMNITW